MSERGLRLPLGIAEAVIYEHHFPRAWYYMEREEGKSNSSGGRPGSAGGVRKMFAEVPYILKKRPARQCGSKAICGAFAGVASPHRRRGGVQPVVSSIIQRPSASDKDVTVTHLDLTGLQDLTISSPEMCVLTKFMPPDKPLKRSDAVYVIFSPTAVSIERRVNKHDLDDPSFSADARAGTLSPDHSETAACSPLLADAVRSALHRLAWFIEAVEGRAVLELRAAVQPRQGVLWLAWAERLLLSPYRIAEDRYLSTSLSRFGPGIAVPSDAGSASQAPTLSWDDVESELEARRERLERNRHSVKLYVPSLEDQEGGRRRSSSPYGAWPSFCRDSRPTPDVVAAVDQRFANMYAMSFKAASSSQSPTAGRKPASAVVVAPPTLLAPLVSHNTNDEALSVVMRWAKLARASTPLTLSSAAESETFWASLDTCLAEIAQQGTTFGAPSAAATTTAAAAPSVESPPGRGPLPGHGRASIQDPRRTSISSLHSSRSYATRAEHVRSSSTLRDAQRLHRLAFDLSAHTADLEQVFGEPPSAARGYRATLRVAHPETASPSSTPTRQRLPGLNRRVEPMMPVPAGGGDTTTLAENVILDAIYAAAEAVVATHTAAADRGEVNSSPRHGGGYTYVSPPLTAEIASEIRQSIERAEGDDIGMDCRVDLVAGGPDPLLRCVSADPSAAMRYLRSLLPWLRQKA